MEVTQETTPSQSGSDQFVGGYPRIRDQHKFHSNPELIGVFEEVEGCEILVVARSVLIVRFLDGGVFMEGQIRTVEASRFHELANDDCEEIVSAFTHHAYIEPEEALQQVELKIESTGCGAAPRRLLSLLVSTKHVGRGR
jgi:hypothetical protein